MQLYCCTFESNLFFTFQLCNIYCVAFVSYSCGKILRNCHLRLKSLYFIATNDLFLFGMHGFVVLWYSTPPVLHQLEKSNCYIHGASLFESFAGVGLELSACKLVTFCILENEGAHYASHEFWVMDDSPGG